MIDRTWRRVLLASPLFDGLSRVLQLRQSRRPITTTDVASPARDYNLSVTRSKLTRTHRAEKYYRLLTLDGNAANAQLLIVGPRDVHELLIAWCHGYSWPNIHAIDLSSTHKKIRVMDMERMAYPDGAFDDVAMSNTLSYAGDVFKALAEVARVLRPGGLFAFGQTHIANGSTWAGNLVSGDEIVGMLDKLHLRVLHHETASKVNRLGLHQTSHDFLCSREPSIP